MRIMMAGNLPTPEPLSPADSAGNPQQPETKMEELRKRKHRTEAHAKRLAIRAIDEAGSRRDVARATGRAEGTISHEATDRPHPELYRTLCQLIGSPGTTGLPMAEAFAEAEELSAIVTADEADLVARGLYLLDHENECARKEAVASMLGSIEHAEALERAASVSADLARIIRELTERDIDLHAIWRERRDAA